MKEIWKDIPGYENYQASNLGDIRSLNYNHTKKIRKLNPSIVTGGYLGVSLTKNNKRTTKTVHRLIAKTFLGESKLQVNHKNGIKDDNRLENLEYCTAKENMHHRFYKLGKFNFKTNNPKNLKGKIGKEHPRYKLVGQYSNKGELIQKYYGLAEASRETSINRHNISSCCNGRLKTAGGYIWKYVTI